MTDRELDETDRQIIHCLQGDARNVTTTEIGSQLDVSGSTVANRISQLEESGVIAGYTPLIDYDRCGYHQRHVLVGAVPPENRDRIVDEIAEQRGVVDVTGLLTDEQNVLIDVVASAPDDVAELAEALSALDVRVIRTELVTNKRSRAFDGFGKTE